MAKLSAETWEAWVRFPAIYLKKKELSFAIMAN